jgi:outer membrane protein OmpA-like peptidoglycan-associated protein
MKRMRFIGLAAFPIAVLLAGAGCATKGFVRSQVEDLRTEIGQMNSRLQSEDQKNAEITSSALARADSAFAEAGTAWTAALGKVGLREAGRSRVYFDFNSSDLTADAQSILDQVSTRVSSNPQYVVQIFGFADPVGPSLYNLALAQRRADSVERYLVGNAPEQLTRFRSISFGEEIPRFESGSLGEGKQQRQVLVVLVERTPLGQPEPGIASR